MKMKLKSWSQPTSTYNFDLFKDVEPEALVLSPVLLDALYEKIEAYCMESGGALKRGLIKSQKVREKRAKFLKEGQKVPMFTRIAFNNIKRGFFGKLRKLLGGELKLLVVERGKSNSATRSFFKDMGLEISDQ